MTRDEIRENVLRELARVFNKGGKQVTLTESTSLDELNVNSVQMIDIVLDLEDEFGVDISDSDTPKFQTVAEVVTIIDSLLKAKNTNR